MVGPLVSMEFVDKKSGDNVNVTGLNSAECINVFVPRDYEMELGMNLANATKKCVFIDGDSFSTKGCDFKG